MELKHIVFEEWLIFLYGENIKKRFIHNSKNFPCAPNEQFDNEINYMMLSFRWSDTSEGYDFWSMVNDTWEKYVYSLSDLDETLNVETKFNYGDFDEFRNDNDQLKKIELIFDN